MISEVKKETSRLEITRKTLRNFRHMGRNNVFEG